MLSELLKEDYIQLDISVENFDEAIKASAQPLLTADVIENEYISSILSIYHEIVALHCYYETNCAASCTHREGAKKLALGFTRLERPVISGHESNDPVKFLFPLSAPDNESHISLLSELAELLGNKDFLELLGRMTEKNELIAFLKKFEGENNYA
ncbi:PTS sugar transporter subunit IIA [Enterococcus gallinarum]|nr:PTS sugar transporter subunit IIA [Enterococcus gallinarum]